MKPQDKSRDNARFSVSAQREIRAAYRVLERAVFRQPWLVQGSVNVVGPKSAAGQITYTWTRKVRAKTVTVALSQKQAIVFRRAISANRRIEEALSRLREVSQTAILDELPGVTKRRLDAPRKPETKTIPKGA